LTCLPEGVKRFALSMQGFCGGRIARYTRGLCRAFARTCQAVVVEFAIVTQKEFMKLLAAAKC